MGYSFFEFMKKIGIFIVCAQSIIHFVAGKSYEKYVKLLIGIMILAQFIEPVRAVFLGGDSVELSDSIEHFRVEMEEAGKEMELEYEEGENHISEQVQTEIEDKLSLAGSQYGYIVEDVRISSEPPGILVRLTNSQAAGKAVRIDEIKIDAIGDGKADTTYDSPDEGNEIREDEIKEIKAAFARTLGVDISYLEIEIE